MKKKISPRIIGLALMILTFLATAGVATSVIAPGGVGSDPDIAGPGS